MISKWSIENGTGGADTLSHFPCNHTSRGLDSRSLSMQSATGFPETALAHKQSYPILELVERRRAACLTIPYRLTIPFLAAAASSFLPFFPLSVLPRFPPRCRIHGPPRTVPCPEGNIVARGPPSLAMTPPLASMAMMSKHCRHRRRCCQRRLIWDEEGAGERAGGEAQGDSGVRSGSAAWMTKRGEESGRAAAATRGSWPPLAE